jgi:glycosyltransferase involved in cell wall biosynthesis
MSLAPEVSICIPTFNGREHLRECLESVRSQTFGNYEVLVCDDRSSDGSLDYAREFAKADERFRFIANPRRFGLVGNWNNCIAVSRGKWIKYLFQDDVLLPECLERMTAAALREDSRFLACRREFQFAENTAAATRSFYAGNAASIDRFYSSGNTCPPDRFAEAILNSITANFVGEPSVTLIHREVFERFGLFNENLIMCCDSEFWYRVGTHVPVTFVPETLVRFRVHDSSTSAQNFGRRRFRMELLDPLIVVCEFLNNPNYDRIRHIARTRLGPRHLQYAARQWARRARIELEHKQASHSEDAVLCREEWEAVCRVYPQIQGFAQPPKATERLWSLKQNWSLRKVAERVLRSVGLRRSP